MIALLSFTLARSDWFWGWIWGPPELGGQRVPDSETTSEVDWLLDAPWAKVALLITVAVGVLVLANTLTKNKGKRRGIRRKPDFDLQVAKLEDLAVTPIASAKAGPIHLVGTLRKGDGALGTGEHACVFQNRAGSSRATAIAAELVLLGDETGVVGLEQLEAARVIAPREDHGPHDTIALYLGDRVEVVGELMVFNQPQTAGGEPLRGMLGSLGQIQVRLLERAKPDAPEPGAKPVPKPAPADVDSADASGDPTFDSDSSP